MKKFGIVGLAAAVIALGSSVGGFAQTGPGGGAAGGGSFGGRMRGLTTMRGEIVCTDCSIEEVEAGQPQLRNLYELTHEEGRAVMHVQWAQNTANGSPGRDQRMPGGLWSHILWQPSQHLAVRAPGYVIRELTAEENLFKTVEVTGILRTTRVFDIADVNFLG